MVSRSQRGYSSGVIQNLCQALFSKVYIGSVTPLDKFYPAEDYHQEYFSHHPEQAYCQMVISPKVNKFRQQWAKRLKR